VPIAFVAANSARNPTAYRHPKSLGYGPSAGAGLTTTYRPGVLETYSAWTAVERFDMADNLMMVGAVAEAGFRVDAAAVPPGEEMTSLAGFHRCLLQLSGRGA
jgi:hypothetical protein